MKHLNLSFLTDWSRWRDRDPLKRVIRPERDWFRLLGGWLLAVMVLLAAAEIIFLRLSAESEAWGPVASSTAVEINPAQARRVAELIAAEQAAFTAAHQRGASVDPSR